MLGTGEYNMLSWIGSIPLDLGYKYSGMLCETIYKRNEWGVGGGGGTGEVGDDFPLQVKETSDHEIEGEKLKLTEWYLR